MTFTDEDIIEGLMQRLPRPTCVDAEGIRQDELDAYAKNELVTAQTIEHLRGCAYCRLVVHELRSMPRDAHAD